MTRCVECISKDIFCCPTLHRPTKNTTSSGNETRPAPLEADGAQDASTEEEIRLDTEMQSFVNELNEIMEGGELFRVTLRGEQVERFQNLGNIKAKIDQLTVC